MNLLARLDVLRPPQIRSDGSVAPGESELVAGPRQCGECAGNPWTICGVCGRGIEPGEYDEWGLMNWDDDEAEPA